MIDTNLIYDLVCGTLLAIFTISLISNLIVLGIFVRVKDLKKPINVLMITHLILNLIITVTYIPFSFFNCFFEKNVFSNRVTNLETYIMYWANIFIVHLITAMSCERFWIAHKPIEVQMINYRSSIYIVLFLGIFAMIWSAFPLIGWSHFTMSKYGFTCGLDWNDRSSFKVVSYNVLSILIYFIIPFVILLFTNGSLIQVHRAKIRIERRGTGETPIHIDETRLEKESKYKFLIVVLTSTAIFFSWAPYTIISIYTAFIKPYGISEEIHVFTSLLAKGSIIWFPIIELIFDEDVARGTKFNATQTYEQEEREEEATSDETRQNEDSLKKIQQKHETIDFEINKANINIAAIRGSIY